MFKSIFYKPEDGWIGDIIPYYHNNKFYLYYLHDPRINGISGQGYYWRLLTTEDFVNFEDHGGVLPQRGIGAQDYNQATGCVLEHEGIYHIYYTGINMSFREKADKREQAILHAISDDMVHWERIEDDIVVADTDIYEPHDFRDPFIFWNEEAEEFWMLAVAKIKNGPDRRRGCTALCVSKDLKSWEHKGPFWNPGMYSAHECPDLFKIGEWWYHVFSTYSERQSTHYRMSRSLEGPWLSPPSGDGNFDGRAFYAAKTVADKDGNRYVVAWIPSKYKDIDQGGWQWGGCLAAHKLTQQPDGSLAVSPPDAIETTAALSGQISCEIGLGKWKQQGNNIVVSSPDGYSCTCSKLEYDSYMLCADVRVEESAKGFGFILNGDMDCENAYYIRLEQENARMVFDLYPRNGAVPFAVELERRCRLEKRKTHRLKVIVNGTAGTAYLDDTVAMCFRMYRQNALYWGVFVTEGEAAFQNINVKYLPAIQKKENIEYGKSV